MTQQPKFPLESIRLAIHSGQIPQAQELIRNYERNNGPVKPSRLREYAKAGVINCLITGNYDSVAKIIYSNWFEPDTLLDNDIQEAYSFVIQAMFKKCQGMDLIKMLEKLDLNQMPLVVTNDIQEAIKEYKQSVDPYMSEVITALNL